MSTITPTRGTRIDEDRLEALFRAHYAALVRMAFVLTSNPHLAEDLVQEAFLGFWRARPLIQADVEAIAYIKRTIVNLVRRSFRRRLLAVRERYLVARSESDDDTAERLSLLHELKRLPFGQRACIVLRYYEGLSERETADILGVSTGTVKSQTHDAIAKLRRAWGEQ